MEVIGAKHLLPFEQVGDCARGKAEFTPSDCHNNTLKNVSPRIDPFQTARKVRP